MPNDAVQNATNETKKTIKEVIGSRFIVSRLKYSHFNF